MPVQRKFDVAKHHPWCNRHNQSRAGCTVCDDYYKRYPTCNQMEELYFPTRHLNLTSYHKKRNKKEEDNERSEVVKSC